MRTAPCFALTLSVALLGASSGPAAPARRPASSKRASLKPARRPASSGSSRAGSPAAAAGGLRVVQPLIASSGHWAPSGSLQAQGFSGPAVWRVNSHHIDGHAPLFPPAPLGADARGWSPGARNTRLPDTMALGAVGEFRREPARWMTAASGPRSLTVPVGAEPTYPPVQLTPQTSGNVVPVGARLPIGVTLTNLTPRERSWTLTYLLQSASGFRLDSGQLPVRVPADARVTVPLSAGPVSLPGSVTLSVVAREGAASVGSAATGGGAIPRSTAIRTSEFPFGLIGGDAMLARAAGVQFWAGGWPWGSAGDSPPNSSRDFGSRADPSPGSAEGFFALADRMGISLISRTYMGSPEAEVRYAEESMDHFKRRSGGWTVPYAPDMTPAAYGALMRSLFSASKAVHKEARTFLELPPATGGGIEVGQTASASGADYATDVLAVEGLRAVPSSDAFNAALAGVVDLRDRAFPGREIWSMGETIPAPASSAIDAAGRIVRDSVEQLVGGIDKVFWPAGPDLMRDDDTAGPGFFGLASLSQFLAGAEYVGPMPWPAPLRGEVFQKNGTAVLVAWSEGATRQVQLPLLSARTPEVRDPMDTTANIAFLFGRKLTLTRVPIYVTDLGKSLLAEARQEGRARRLAALRADLEALGAGDAASLPADVTGGAATAGDGGVALLQSIMGTYHAEAPRRGQVLNAVDRLLRLWDGDVLSRAASDTTAALLSADKALDTANHAQADLREELDHREGLNGYQPDMRILLAQVERRLWLARQGLRQKDYALAKAHAEQMAAAARALIPYVKILPVTQLPQPYQKVAATD